MLEGAEKTKTERHHDSFHPPDQFPAPTLSNPTSLSSTLSNNSDRSALDAATHVHPPTPDMDGADGYVRRRPLLMENEDLPPGAKADKRSRSRRHRRKLSQGPGEGENRHLGYSSDDGHSSTFSTPSASEDVEMERMLSDEALTDDEEAGLTRTDKRKRKRRKTINTKLDERVAGSIGASTSRWSLADRNVIKASLVNALLIASWYLFSVSISVVSRALALVYYVELTPAAVQSMDVFPQEPQLPLSPFHHMYAHGRAISTGLYRAVFHPAF